MVSEYGNETREFVLDVKSDKDIWAFDKELLKGYDLDIEVDWDAHLPTNKEAYNLLIKKQNQWRSPTERVSNLRKIFDRTLERIVSDVQEVWNVKFLELPDFEILSEREYLPRLNQLQREISSEVGYGSLSSSPPSMSLSTHHGKLLIPEKSLIRTKKNKSRPFDSEEYDVTELDWDLAFFEEVFASELSFAMFRQLRGEWKRDYIEVMKKLGPNKLLEIIKLNEVISQQVREKLASEKYPKWRLYVIADKIQTIWRDRYFRRAYLAVDALSKVKGLSQIAAVDEVYVAPQGNRVLVNFYPEHPFNLEKQKRFENMKN